MLTLAGPLLPAPRVTAERGRGGRRVARHAVREGGRSVGRHLGAPGACLRPRGGGRLPLVSLARRGAQALRAGELGRAPASGAACVTGGGCAGCGRPGGEYMVAAWRPARAATVQCRAVGSGDLNMHISASIIDVGGVGRHARIRRAWGARWAGLRAASGCKKAAAPTAAGSAPPRLSASASGRWRQSPATAAAAQAPPTAPPCARARPPFRRRR